VVVKSPWVPQLKDTTKDTPVVNFHDSMMGQCSHTMTSSVKLLIKASLRELIFSSGIKYKMLVNYFKYKNYVTIKDMEYLLNAALNKSLWAIVIEWPNY